MSEQFNLYAFSSEDFTNIWAGVGAETWAVQTKPNASVRGKAGKIGVPSFGILYAAAEQVLTVPFVILTKPDQTRIERDIWRGEWALPFRIKPLGTPRKTLPAIKAREIVPSFNRLRTDNFGKVFRVSGSYAFNRCDALQDDWDVLLDWLAD
ncbi:MAG TPA: hypothetical protein VNJ05_02055 [Sphingomicrobium sp.]|nr:hypothetical protein [Sphingomicrobium sp.]